MAFRIWTKTKDETATPTRASVTGPLPQLPQGRHVPTMAEVRRSWQGAHADGAIPAVANLFGDATGSLLRGRLGQAQSVDDFVGIIEEARSYGDNDIALLALDKARSLAIRGRDLRQIDALEAALQPSELEKALQGGFGG
ncbi:MAG: hypothetical protein H7338_01390 [Candidatus Sericytochromatia bacterium]|nr:hypothetical protein [Candidatus Sericytochromatia bacterium]